MSQGFDNSWRLRLQHYPQSSEFKNLFEELKEELPLPDRKLPTPLAISFIGIPGAGKSTISQGLQSFIPTLHLRSDVIGLYRLPRGPEYDYYKAYVIQEALARYYLQNGWSVIMDDNNRTRRNREKTYQLAQQYRARSILFSLRIPLSEATMRVRNREIEHKKGIGVRSLSEIHRQLQGFQNQVEDPSPEELAADNVLFRSISALQPIDQIMEAIQSDQQILDLLK